MAIVLIVKTPDGEVSDLPIFGKCTVGRSSKCDFVVKDKLMSGVHGAFEIKNKQLLYKDLGSTNGSFLNNNQIEHTPLRLGETLRIGNSEFRIDEKRLLPSEKQALGASSGPAHKKGLTLAQAEKSKTIPPRSAGKNAISPEFDWTTSSVENVIEQEESSGQTKFLKLTDNKSKSKK